MKSMRIFFALFLTVVLLFTSCSNSSNTGSNASGLQKQDTGKAVLVFKEYEHAFGKVAEGEKVGYVFNFENKGTGDLIIVAAITSCGCTVSKYDRKPIHPGKEGKLEVVFDTSGRNGLQTKTITIRSNATVPVVMLKITAEVESDES
jgi:hypothetical protein